VLLLKAVEEVLAVLALLAALSLVVEAEQDHYGHILETIMLVEVLAEIPVPAQLTLVVLVAAVAVTLLLKYKHLAHLEQVVVGAAVMEYPLADQVLEVLV
jgi:hypothetical protein